MAEWSDNQIGAQFRLEIQQRFEAENAEYRAREAQELTELRMKLGEKLFQRRMGDIEVRDSFLWEIFEGTEVITKGNLFTFILPLGYAITTELVDMFDNTSVAWSRPFIKAVIHDGEAHVAVEVLLVDYHDDERHEKWCKEHAQ